VQTRINLVQLAFVLDLNPELIEARLLSSRGDSEIDTRIIERPLDII